MGLFTFLLIIAIALIVVGMIWNDKNWVTVYEGNSTSQAGTATSKLVLLKSKGIQCRTKTTGPMWMQSNMQNNSMQTTIKILVKKQDEDKAYSVLAKNDH